MPCYNQLTFSSLQSFNSFVSRAQWLVSILENAVQGESVYHPSSCESSPYRHPKQFSHSMHRPRSGLAYVSKNFQVTLIQDPRTVSSFYSPVNARGVKLLRSDSAPSFLGITNGPPFSSIGVHDPPTSRLAANRYVSSELNLRGRQRGACLFLCCLW